MAIETCAVSGEVLNHGRQTAVEDSLGDVEGVFADDLWVGAVGTVANKDPGIEVSDRGEIHGEAEISER